MSNHGTHAPKVATEALLAGGKEWLTNSTIT